MVSSLPYTQKSAKSRKGWSSVSQSVAHPLDIVAHGKVPPLFFRYNMCFQKGLVGHCLNFILHEGVSTAFKAHQVDNNTAMGPQWLSGTSATSFTSIM